MNSMPLKIQLPQNRDVLRAKRKNIMKFIERANIRIIFEFFHYGTFVAKRIRCLSVLKPDYKP